MMNEFENLCSHFLLIFIVSKRINIDNNLLNQLNIKNVDYLSLNLQKKILINNVLNSSIFDYIKNFDGEFCEELKNRVDIIRKN